MLDGCFEHLWSWGPPKIYEIYQLIWILENGLKRVGENSRWQAVPVWNLRISRIMVKELHVAVVDAIFGPRLLRDTAGYEACANWSSTDGQLSYKGVPQMPCCPWLWVLLWCFVLIAGSHYRRSRWSPSSWEPVLSPGLWSTHGWHGRGGKTMKMYHGTTYENGQSIIKNGFNPSSGGMLGQGVYLSADIEKAKRHGSLSWWWRRSLERPRK